MLQDFAAAIASGSIRVLDLSQTLRASTPVIQLPPPFAQSSPFSATLISRYDDRGPGWYWNNLAMGEHTGTHFDAPIPGSRARTTRPEQPIRCQSSE